MTRERLHTVEDKEFYNKGTCESWIPLFSNAAVLDEDYRLKNEPRLLYLNKKNIHDMPAISYTHIFHSPAPSFPPLSTHAPQRPFRRYE